ncbi:MAG TPA: tetratricopeptide repeat protein [Pyrinomonadaceae bacterium]|nr:tetratricopeptide repeat protein [Pyrinomonadaceae bacterium]
MSACTAKTAPVNSVSTVAPVEIADTKSLARGKDDTMTSVAFLQERVKSDPDDVVALNKLSSYYLQLHRETDDVGYLDKALQTARSSLRVLKPDQNLGGLRALALAEYETHNFVGARDHAKELTEYEPRRSLGFQLLGDALLELGDYDKAANAYQQMEALDPNTVATESRLARLAMLRGDSTTARKRFARALDHAKAETSPSTETIAWCLWQLGEMAKSTGEYDAAQRFYRDSLVAFPEYPHAAASLAQLRASMGQVDEAIETLERVVHKHPDPVDAATLGDLYKLKGRDAEAQEQYAAVERMCLQSELYSTLFNRHLVLFWADHDLKPDDAYGRAKREFETRRDIYAADALAWAALKAGKVDEAQAAIKDALRLGTQDARLFYHAGMIARARGDRASANEFLERALKLNKHFDPLQATIAANALKELALAD